MHRRELVTIIYLTSIKLSYISRVVLSCLVLSCLVYGDEEAAPPEEVLLLFRPRTTRGVGWGCGTGGSASSHVIWWWVIMCWISWSR